MKNNIDIASLILQILSLDLLFKDFNNVDIMAELQKQDNEYFNKIIKNQEEILTLLRKEDNNARKIRENN